MKDLAQKLACYRKCPGYVIFTSISTGLYGLVTHCLTSAENHAKSGLVQKCVLFFQQLNDSCWDISSETGQLSLLRWIKRKTTKTYSKYG